MMNPLSYLSSKWRIRLYLTVVLIGVVLSSLAAGYAGIEHDSPEWLTFATAFMAPIAALTGAVAASNVVSDKALNVVQMPVVDPAAEGYAANQANVG